MSSNKSLVDASASSGAAGESQRQEGEHYSHEAAHGMGTSTRSDGTGFAIRSARLRGSQGDQCKSRGSTLPVRDQRRWPNRVRPGFSGHP